MTRASSIAYDTIRQLILDGVYAPGQRMLEEELAQRVGVSRTSVRDSLRRLAGEGLVHIESSRGTFVAELESAEIDEIFQLRAMLEGHATALAAIHATSADLDALSAIATEIDQLLLQTDQPEAALFSSFQRCNTRFPTAILRASGSRRLQSMSTALLELPLVTMKQHIWPGEVSVRRSNAQHWDIIEALRARDPTLGRLRLQAHIMSTRPRAMIAQQALAPFPLL
jgi:DNA-binding GntR family transcriptional regulator